MLAKPVNNVLKVEARMKFFFYGLTSIVAVLATGCGTSSSTVTGPLLDRCAIVAANSMSSVGASGGSGRVSVDTGRECPWSVTSGVPWITPMPPVGGQGIGGVDFVAAANPSAESRRGTLVVGGHVFEVVQEGLSCRFDLQPVSQNLGAEGGSGSFTVEAPSGCSWTPAASDEWITITDPGSHSGNGSVTFSVAANGGAARDGTVVVGGQAFTILQAAPSCRYQLSPITGSFGGAGGSGTIGVTAASGCNWTASASVPWISIEGGASGGGNGSVGFTVQANTGPARNGIITIGGQRFTVTQAQAACSYSVVPGDSSFAVSGGQGSVTISTNAACTWTTSDVPPWVTGLPASGTGALTINFAVGPNPGPVRSANIIIAGQSFAVSQAAGCTYSLAPGSHAASAAGGPTSFAITTAAGCAWTSTGAPAWITGVPASGTGPQTINVTLTANTGAARSANIIIGGQTFAVTQAASGCTYSLKPASHSAAAAGGASSFVVSTAAGCAWTSTGAPAWITGVPASGTGPQTINVTLTANTGAARSANIIIGGQTFAVTQAASGCTYSLKPASHSAAAAGGASSFVVSTAAGCGWTSSGVPAWITGVPASGTGTATINFTVAANPNPAPRSVNISVGGQTFTVTQAAGCSYSLSPGSYAAAGAGGSSTFAVNTAAGCSWTSSGVPAWITGVPASGTGQSTINFSVTAHTGPTRSANISIAGQTFAVNQASGCTYGVAPASLTFAAFGVPLRTIAVTTSAGCAWTATPNQAWIRILSGGSGTGSGSITVDLLVNSTGTARQGNIAVGGRTVTITQNQ